jgi:threonyl-tRNA synthetase
MRRLGSQQQVPLTLDEAIAMLTQEAMPPDVLREQKARSAAA